jgi:carbon-monoxide dehydrogenase small subunit
MLMTADTFLRDADDPDREEIREAIDGNLCRCTGYHNIVDAIEATDRLGGEVDG